MPEKSCPQCDGTLVKYHDGDGSYWECPGCVGEVREKPRRRKIEVIKTTIRVKAPAPSKGYGIASSALGILSLLLFYIPIMGAVAAVAGVLTGAAGLVNAVRKRKARAGFSVAGIVLSGFGLIPMLLVALGSNGATTTKDANEPLVADVQADSRVSTDIYDAATSKPPDKPVTADVQPDPQKSYKDKQASAPPRTAARQDEKVEERPVTRNPTDSKLANANDRKLEKPKADEKAEEKQRQAKAIEAVQRRAREAKDREEKMAKQELAALSRIGVAKLLINDKEYIKAEAKLQEIVKRYPDTNAAKIAKKMLDDLENR